MFAVETNACSDGRFASFFAIELTGIRVAPNEERRGAYDDFLKKLLYRQMDFVRSLQGLSEDTALDLRYMFDPAKPRDIRVFLLVRISAKTSKKAASQAGKVGTYLLHLLMVNNYMHEFTAVKDVKELAYLLKPFRPAHIVDIVRREDIVPLDALRQTASREIGFYGLEHDGAEQTAGNTIYYAFPLAPGLCAMERLCHILLLQKAHCLFSVCIKPYKLTVNDEDHFEERLKRCEKFSQLGFKGGVDNVGTLDPFLQKQASLFYHTCASELFQLHDAAFLVKMQIASSRPIAEELTTIVGTSITEHTGHPDFVFVQESDKPFAGGYEVRKPQNEAEYKTALSNLNGLEFQMWGATQAPQEMRHWRYLFDVSESIAPFRLPLPLVAEFPGLETILFNSKTAPTNLPSEGLFLGVHSHMSQLCPVYLPKDDRRRHMYTVGQTGTGKSKFFLQMIVQDMKAGNGVAVFDPHGELIEDILRHVPPKRQKDIVYIDPGMPGFAFGINMLEAETPVEKDFCVNYLMEIFDRLYDLRLTGGPLFEQYMRNAILALLEQPDGYQPGLNDVIRIFEETDFRKKMLKTCTNASVVSFWTNQAEKAGGEGSLSNMAPYVTSKLTGFMNNSTARDILCQRRSTIDMRQIMDEGKILLVDLRKGLLGETTVRFLGMLLVGKIFFSALGRANVKDKSTLRDFYLYVDEFQNFITDTFVSALSEARKYRLCLTLTNQYVNQLHDKHLNDKVINSIFGNIGTLVSFRVGAKDADLLYNEFGGSISKTDLQGISNFNAYARLLIDGAVTSPFNFRTVLPELPTREVDQAAVIERCVKTYYRSRDEVAAEIRKEWTA